jgi:hypothetical protein
VPAFKGRPKCGVQPGGISVLHKIFNGGFRKKVGSVERARRGFVGLYFQ